MCGNQSGIPCVWGLGERKGYELEKRKEKNNLIQVRRMKWLEVERSTLCDYAVSNLGPALLTDVVLLHGSLKSDPERERDIYIYISRVHSPLS